MRVINGAFSLIDLSTKLHLGVLQNKIKSIQINFMSAYGILTGPPPPENKNRGYEFIERQIPEQIERDKKKEKRDKKILKTITKNYKRRGLINKDVESLTLKKVKKINKKLNETKENKEDFFF
jgi:hypothetical protein